MWITFYILVLIASIVEAKPPRTNVTVSGLSSGAAMAAQLHLAFGSQISGSGIVAGPPYYCAQNNLIYAVTECLYGPAALIPVTKLESQLQAYVQAGSADPTSHLKNDPVYIFSGTSDHVVNSGVVKINEQIFGSVGAQIKTNYEIPAAHGFVTDNFGGLCELPNVVNYINNCSFNLAYAVLNHLFGGNLTKPSATKPVPLHGQFVTIEQPALMNPGAVQVPDSTSKDIFSYWANWLKKSATSYKRSFHMLSGLNIIPTLKLPGTAVTSSSVDASGFDKEGFVYYPSGCPKGKKCPIHVALHGCLQGKSFVNDVFAKKAGYLEVAELNHIIMFFPQIAPTFQPLNEEGCWDWWGYGGTDYANKQGAQMAGVMQMVHSIQAINDALAA